MNSSTILLDMRRRFVADFVEMVFWKNGGSGIPPFFPLRHDSPSNDAGFRHTKCVGRDVLQAGIHYSLKANNINNLSASVCVNCIAPCENAVPFLYSINLRLPQRRFLNSLLFSKHYRVSKSPSRVRNGTIRRRRSIFAGHPFLSVHFLLGEQKKVNTLVFTESDEIASLVGKGAFANSSGVATIFAGALFPAQTLELFRMTRDPAKRDFRSA